MPFYKLIISYLLTTVVFFAVDMAWLGLIAKGLYKKYLGSFLSDKVNWPAAIIFYLLFIIGIFYFAILPAVEKNSLAKAIKLMEDFVSANKVWFLYLCYLRSYQFSYLKRLAASNRFYRYYLGRCSHRHCKHSRFLYCKMGCLNVNCFHILHPYHFCLCQRLVCHCCL